MFTESLTNNELNLLNDLWLMDFDKARNIILAVPIPKARSLAMYYLCGGTYGLDLPWYELLPILKKSHRDDVNTKTSLDIDAPVDLVDQFYLTFRQSKYQSNRVAIQSGTATYKRKEAIDIIEAFNEYKFHIQNKELNDIRFLENRITYRISTLLDEKNHKVFQHISEILKGTHTSSPANNELQYHILAETMFQILKQLRLPTKQEIRNVIIKCMNSDEKSFSQYFTKFGLSHLPQGGVQK